MVKGIGIDIVGIDRIKNSINEYGDKFLDRIYTSKEVKYCKNRKALKFPELAARFAAKEAYTKAIGTGMTGIHWNDIEVLNEKNGRPYLNVRGKKQKNTLVSLSHDNENAIAFVIVQ